MYLHQKQNRPTDYLVHTILRTIVLELVNQLNSAVTNCADETALHAAKAAVTAVSALRQNPQKVLYT